MVDPKNIKICHLSKVIVRDGVRFIPGHVEVIKGKLYKYVCNNPIVFDKIVDEEYMEREEVGKASKKLNGFCFISEKVYNRHLALLDK